jgi:hypothetical protein
MLKGVLLLDAPFQLPKGALYDSPLKYRNFLRSRSRLDAQTSISSQVSNRGVLIQHIKERGQSTAFLEAVRADQFLILGDIYRLVASNWIMHHEHVDLELATMERELEKGEPTFHELETHLKHFLSISKAIQQIL